MTEPAISVHDQAILQHLCNEHWAMQESTLDRLLEIVGRHAEGVKLPPAEIAEAIAAKPSRKDEDEYRVEGDTALIGISGVLAKHASMVNGVSQPTGSSAQRIRADLDRAMADHRVKNILLRIESPGGMVAGISDLGEAILAARATKRVVAFADDMAASAAYWLASQASEVYANKSAAVGSIGVVSVLVDESERAGKNGTRFHVVRSGARKGSGGAPVPVSEAELAEAQGRVNALHEVFLADVARGRGLAADAIRPVADGRVLTGQQAVDAGLVDGIATLDGVLAMLAAPHASSGRPGVPAAHATLTVAAGDKESDMTIETKSPQVPPAASADEIRASAVKAANEAAAERVKALSAVLGNRTELLTRAIAEGMDVTTAKAELAGVLAQENAALTAELAQAHTQAQATAAELASLKDLVAQSGIKPLSVGGKSDSGQGHPDGGEYEAKVAEQVKAGLKESRARINAAKLFPAEHAAWLKSQQPK